MAAVAAPQVVVQPPPPAPFLLFIVNAKNGATIWLEVSQQVTCEYLGTLVLKHTGIPVKDQMLIFKGEKLNPNAVMKNTGVKSNDIITLLDVRDTPDEIMPPPPPEEPKEDEEEDAGKGKKK